MAMHHALYRFQQGTLFDSLTAVCKIDWSEVSRALAAKPANCKSSNLASLAKLEG
jgi:hypothetical protein